MSFRDVVGTADPGNGAEFREVLDVNAHLAPSLLSRGLNQRNNPASLREAGLLVYSKWREGVTESTVVPVGYYPSPE